MKTHAAPVDSISALADRAAVFITEHNTTVIGRLLSRTHVSYMPFGYAAHRQDGTSFVGEHQAAGLYMLGNGRRAYLPRLMRFVMPDRLGPFRSPDRHTYAYCTMDPINRLDRNADYSFQQIAKQIAVSFSHWRRARAWANPPQARATAKFISVPLNGVIRLGKGAFAWNADTTIHLLAHGNSQGVSVGNTLLTAPFLAKRIRKQFGNNLSAVHLYSCEAGIGSPSYLQALADKLEMPVSGSSGKVFTLPTPEDLEGIYQDLPRSERSAKQFNVTFQNLNYSAASWRRYTPGNLA